MRRQTAQSVNAAISLRLRDSEPVVHLYNIIVVAESNPHARHTNPAEHVVSSRQRGGGSRSKYPQAYPLHSS